MKVCEYWRSRSFLYHIFSRFCMFCSLLGQDIRWAFTGPLVLWFKKFSPKKIWIWIFCREIWNGSNFFFFQQNLKILDISSGSDEIIIKCLKRHTCIYKENPSLMFSGDGEIPTRGFTVPVGNEPSPSFPQEPWTRGLGFPGSTVHQWLILFLTYLINYFTIHLARHCGLPLETYCKNSASH